MNLWIALVLLAGMVAGFCWNLARLVHADRKRQLHRLELELRLTHALETFHREVFRLKHYRVLRPKVPETAAAGLIPSTKVSSLRYIKGRQHED